MDTSPSPASHSSSVSTPHTIRTMTVTPLARRIDRQFQRNHQRHVLASELSIKVERLRGCFAGSNSLPSPTPKITAAWNDLPNTLTDNLPMSMKAKWVFPPAPPPTPTGLDLDKDKVISSESFKLSTTNDGGTTSRCSQPGQPSDRQNSEESSIQSTDSSDPESSSSGGRISTEPVGFWNAIKQWLLDYRARGAEAFVHTLIAFGVESTATAQVAAQIAHAIIHKLRSGERKHLEMAIRLTTLATFKKCWWSNDIETKTTVIASAYGLHLASFIGSLFTFRVACVRDIHVCLTLLLEGEKSLDRLCAIHALLVQADDRLCKKRYLQTLLEFQRRIVARDEGSGEYFWAKTPYAETILADIITTIERWIVIQAIKRDQSRPSACRIPIRNRAVGPRKRNTPVVPPQEQ